MEHAPAAALLHPACGIDMGCVVRPCHALLNPWRRPGVRAFAGSIAILLHRSRRRTRPASRRSSRCRSNRSPRETRGGGGGRGETWRVGIHHPMSSKSSKKQADPCFGESRTKSVGNNPCAQPSWPWHKGQPSQELLTLSYRPSDPCSQIHLSQRLQTWSSMMDPRNQRTRTRASTAAARTARTSHHGLPLFP